MEVATEKNGWVKFHRKTLDNPIIMKDADHLAVWSYLLLSAMHAEYPALFKGKKIILQPGQLITGRKSIAEKLMINESKVTRILNAFESEQQIEQQASNKNRLISLKNWDVYQSFEQQNDHPVNNKRTTTEQQVNTNKNVKNNKKDNNDINISIVEYLNEKVGTKYKPTSKETQTCIHARLTEGFTVEDFKTVIDKKCTDWIGTEYEQYLRPETLFGTKFEAYLNAKVVKKQSTRKEPAPKWMSKNQNQYDFEDIEKNMTGNAAKTTDDPELDARIQALKERLQV